MSFTTMLPAPIVTLSDIFTPPKYYSSCAYLYVISKNWDILAFIPYGYIMPYCTVLANDDIWINCNAETMPYAKIFTYTRFLVNIEGK